MTSLVIISRGPTLGDGESQLSWVEKENESESVPSAEKRWVLHTQMIRFLASPQLLLVHLERGSEVERGGARVYPRWMKVMMEGWAPDVTSTRYFRFPKMSHDALDPCFLSPVFYSKRTTGCLRLELRISCGARANTKSDVTVWVLRLTTAICSNDCV